MTPQNKGSNALLDAVNRAVPTEGTHPKPQKQASEYAKVNTTKAPNTSRAGTKLVAGHFDPKVSKQLRMIAVEEETTVQALLEEALDLLFVKKGRAHINEITNQ